MRREAHLSQAQFAARIEINEKSYVAYETDTNRSRDVVAIAQRIEREFGVPATWVLGMDSGRSNPFPGGSSRSSMDTGWYPYTRAA